MKEHDFSKNVAKRSGVSQADVHRVFEAQEQELLDVLKAKDHVTIAGVKIEGEAKPASSGVSALTGKPWKKPAHTAAKAKIMPSLKKALL